jgi:hypothetical protein
MKPAYKITICVLGGVLVVWVLWLLIPMFLELQREVDQVLRDTSDYSNRLVTHEYDRAYGHCSDAFRAATPYDRFISLYQGLEKQYGPLKSAQPQNFEAHGHGEGLSSSTPMMWRAEVDERFIYEKKTLFCSVCDSSSGFCFGWDP